MRAPAVTGVDEMGTRAGTRGEFRDCPMTREEFLTLVRQSA